jgi:hypothetical protein
VGPHFHYFTTPSVRSSAGGHEPGGQLRFPAQGGAHGEYLLGVSHAVRREW